MSSSRCPERSDPRGVGAPAHRGRGPAPRPTEGRPHLISPPLLVVAASLLFAMMGVCVKLASSDYGTGEIVMYRGAMGAILIWLVSRWRGDSLATRLPLQHAVRACTGVVALCLWFYALGGLHLATAMTLNYTSSLWLALFLLGGIGLLGRRSAELMLALTALLGFVGVVLVLRPEVEGRQLWFGIAGLLSGMVSATGYLQVGALGRAGEPEARIVFYFSLGGVAGGAALAAFSGWHAHSWRGAALLVAIGLLSTVGQLLLTRAYARGRTLVNASLQYLGIGFSFLFGVFLFRESFTWTATLGMALIVAAGVLATMLRAAPEPGGRLATSKP